MQHLEFGDFLYRCARQRGWSMADLAERCDVSPSTISRIRTGRRKPATELVAKLVAVLELTDEDARQFEDLAVLAQAPAALRARLMESENRYHEERSRRTAVEQGYGEFRREHSFYDGYWLAYNAAFADDGTIARSLAVIDGDTVRWRNVVGGETVYSYTGSIAVLGDKVFLNIAEDRGDMEHVQVVMHSLFDFREPAFLYGLVTGISGKNVHHPRSEPVAAKMIMIYAGREDDLRRNPERLEDLEALLGTFAPERIAPFRPACLGKADYLRTCLGLKPREDMDALILKMLDNHVPAGRNVLTAQLA